MKKTGVLHAELSRVIAALGHGDLLVIADAGLPVPRGVPCIDLAVAAGVPGFSDVLAAVATEMCVELAFVASETLERSPAVATVIEDLNVPLRTISHEDLKARSASAVAVVRTGEFTPYANVILSAGVVFG